MLNPITLTELFLILVPVLVVIFVSHRWFGLRWTTTLVATARMIIQLLAIGFFLVFIFERDDPIFSCLLLSVMLLIASWITTRVIKIYRRKYFLMALTSMTMGCLPILALVNFVILDNDPWYRPSGLIPIAGMIFANVMNALSLGMERLNRELEISQDFTKAKREAFQSALIPIMNSFLAVGLVSMPGMMTGQIIAGVDPLIAVRYQVVVMAMVFSASGVSLVAFFILVGRSLTPSAP